MPKGKDAEYLILRDGDDVLLATVRINSYGRVKCQLSTSASRPAGDWEAIARVVSRITGKDHEDCYQLLFVDTDNDGYRKSR